MKLAKRHKRSDDEQDRIAELEDTIKQRDRRIEGLRQEIDEQRDLIDRMEEEIEESNQTIESWIHGFDMETNEAGDYVWKASFVYGDEWYDKYKELLRKWNKFVPDYNAMVAVTSERNVGRPLAASEAQCDHVRELREQGMSLRGIAEETSLGLNTVRTIVSKKNGTDRTSIKYLSRIDPDRARMRMWEAKRQQRNALPKRINELLKTNNKLIKEAKGLGR